MTTLKTYAKSRKVTLPKLQALCEAVLDCVPSELSDEQMMQLDAALAAAAERVAALPPGEAGDSEEEVILESEETASLAPNSPEALGETRKVIHIIGEQDLRRHIALFLTHHLSNLQKLRQAHEETLLRFEQDVCRQTGETLQRMTHNADAAYRDVDRLLHPQTPEDHAYYEECLQDVEEFLRLNG